MRTPTELMVFVMLAGLVGLVGLWAIARRRAGSRAPDPAARVLGALGIALLGGMVAAGPWAWVTARYGLAFWGPFAAACLLYAADWLCEPSAGPPGRGSRYTGEREGGKERPVTTHQAKPSRPKSYQVQSFDHLRRLDGISDGQIAEHLQLYAGYVKQVNQLGEQLAEMIGRGQASGKSPEFAELTRRLGFEYNGMILHEYYFSNLRPAADPEPPSGSGLAQALAASFGSVENWKTDFHAIGEMRGVGWVILFEDPATDRLTNHWITLHQDGVPAGFKPLLVMDVWEHAFMRDYKATERGKYIQAFFRNIDWQMVERRLREEAAIRPAA